MEKEIKFISTNDLKQEIAVVVGTRPSIIMFAPIIHALQTHNLSHFVIHTGQHYSPNMDASLFEDLELANPDYRLSNVAEKKFHGAQTAAMLEGIESILMDRKPYFVLVGGDANTNLSGALAARKLHINVGHVEAGERSFDWRMPEEHNRRIIDHISDYLFATGEKGRRHLIEEKVRGKIFVTGNTIVDSALRHLEIATRKSTVLSDFQLKPKRYCIMTSHREENVDVCENLKGGLEGVALAAEKLGLPVFFLCHPRTKKRLIEFELIDWANSLNGITLVDAVRYLDFITFIAHSAMVFTDSGGVQQEAYIHKVPCVTLRENTEWTETLTYGANRLAGCLPSRIVDMALEAQQSTPVWKPIFGFGDTAEKIIAIIKAEAFH